MTTRDLLAEAYDLEQSGNLIGAIELRALYHSERQQQLDQVTPPRLVPFGALPDGTPIMGEHDPIFPRQRTGCVWADVGDFSITASADGISTQMGAIDLEGATPDDLAALRRLLLSDTCDRLFAAARAWENGEPEPPTFAAPALPSVHIRHTEDTDGSSWPVFTVGEGLTRVQIAPEDEWPGVYLNIGHTGINDQIDQIITLEDVRQLHQNLTALLNDPRLGGGLPAPIVSASPWFCDDEIDRENYGKRRGMDYVSGDVEIYIPDAPDAYPISLCLMDEGHIPLSKIEQALPHIMALLADPRVQAERARYEAASAPLMKAA